MLPAAGAALVGCISGRAHSGDLLRHAPGLVLPLAADQALFTWEAGGRPYYLPQARRGGDELSIPAAHRTTITRLGWMPKSPTTLSLMRASKRALRAFSAFSAAASMLLPTMRQVTFIGKAV